MTPGHPRARPACGSPKPSSASRRTASRASAACRPVAQTRSSWPRRNPSVATALRLRALTGPRPAVTLLTVTSASNPAAVRTSRAAGRACRPRGLAITTRNSGPWTVSAGGAVRRRSGRCVSRAADRCGRCRGEPAVGRQERGLRGQRPPRLRRHRLEGVAEAGRDSRGHGALDERRRAQQHALTPFPRQQVQGHLRRQHGAAEIHEDQHAVGRPGLVDGPHHTKGVGAQRATGLVEPAGDRDPQSLRAHLRGELGRALGELCAVADQDQPDHGAAPPCHPLASVSAAVASRSQDDVAPGSWCPALRSPR